MRQARDSQQLELRELCVHSSLSPPSEVGHLRLAQNTTPPLVLAPLAQPTACIHSEIRWGWEMRCDCVSAGFVSARSMICVAVVAKVTSRNHCVLCLESSTVCCPRTSSPEALPLFQTILSSIPGHRTPHLALHPHHEKHLSKCGSDELSDGSPSGPASPNSARSTGKTTAGSGPSRGAKPSSLLVSKTPRP